METNAVAESLWALVNPLDVHNYVTQIAHHTHSTLCIWMPQPTVSGSMTDGSANVMVRIQLSHVILQSAHYLGGIICRWRWLGRSRMTRLAHTHSFEPVQPWHASCQIARQPDNGLKRFERKMESALFLRSEWAGSAHWESRVLCSTPVQRDQIESGIR